MSKNMMKRDAVDVCIMKKTYVTCILPLSLASGLWYGILLILAYTQAELVDIPFLYILIIGIVGP